MKIRNIDTQGIGQRAYTYAQTIIQDSGHLIQAVDGNTDIGIDGYIRIRKRTRLRKIEQDTEVVYENWVDTGNLVGIQIKGVSKIPLSGSNSYYIAKGNKAVFGVNFHSKKKLDAKKTVWKNFVGPIILVFVDLKTKVAWWTDLLDETSYDRNGYSILIKKDQVFDSNSFGKIKRLGKELFGTSELITIKAQNGPFNLLRVKNLKESAKEIYKSFGGKGDLPFPSTINPSLGEIRFSRSGWKHMTRLNRRQMRIINSLILIGIGREICLKVPKYTKVKKGLVRETKQYIKKVEFLTLRANVEFNFRQKSIVQVVLRRVRKFDKINPDRKIPDKIYFHSVYEPYRKE